MTNELKILMYILGCVIQGKDIAPSQDFDTEKIYDLATKQGVWHIIFETLKKHYDVSAYEMRFLTVITKNIAANEFVYKTVKKLEENGIECCYLKGIAVARLYPAPECRVSGDTDILIHPTMQDKASGILKELGYDVEELKENHHHFQAYHKVGKVLEIHNMLYEKPARDILFNGKIQYTEKYMVIETQSGKIKTLGINDGLFFLTVHFIKHFLNSNVNLRQMTDLLLYMEHYKDEIDWDSYNSLLKNLKYDKLIDTIKQVGNTYFEMNFETDITDIDEFLSDFEEERKSIYNYYCSQKTDMNKLEYIKYINSNAEQGKFLHRIFPKQNVMEKLGYKNTDKFLGLILAYIKRIFGLITKIINKKKIEDENEAKKELLKNLDMI